MSEQQEQSIMEGSPLRTERGYTSVDKSIVSQIADRAAREVRGIYLDGRNEQSSGRGRRSPSRGMSVEVGMVETSIDIVMGLDYGWNIGEVTERLREVLTERVETLTGLSVREINITISDVVLPDRDRLRSDGERAREDEDERPEAHSLEALRTDEDEEYEDEELRYQRTETERDEEDEELRELRARIERGEETDDELVQDARSGPLDRDDDEEEVRVEGRDLDEGETAEIDPDDGIDRGTGDRDAEEREAEERKAEERRRDEE